MGRKRLSQKEKRMAREELTRTQVLNLNDFEKITKYEKSISKKPAVLLAIIGVLFITSGFTYPSIIMALKDRQVVNANAKKIVADNFSKKEIIEVCTYQEVSDENELYDLDLNLTFVNNKLKKYVKVISIISNKEKVETINSLYQKYRTYSLAVPEGYTISTNLYDNKLEMKMSVDLAVLDKTKLSVDILNDNIINVEFNYQSDRDDVMNSIKSLGYSCK